MTEIDFTKMLSLYGKWELIDSKRTKYTSGATEPASHGLVLFGKSVDDGTVECEVQIRQATQHCGAFVVFRANGESNYLAAGLGGWQSAYTLFEGAKLQSTRLAFAGDISNLVPGRSYKVRIILDGQRVQVLVDDVKVIDYDRLPTSVGTGLGLFSFSGTGEAVFGPMNVDDRRPNAFIAMPFSPPYTDLYRDAIRPVVEEIQYEPVRVDDVSQPGSILNDIWSQLTEASVVIAEVTEPNPNVYYEIGVAHAFKKPTVLLAQRGTKLPFDLGPHRCIFYENTIPGRAKLITALRSSLSSVLGLASVDGARAA